MSRFAGLRRVVRFNWPWYAAAAVTLEPVGGLQKPSGEMYLRGSL